ncbi:UNKNOWN [Stylonychia lemnae]|uniref:Uncharacterized protein n=1 Tax=Stylonychia lemnae TaxID=5949 RepID=A0A078B9P6_STYLE|nr:UNKNOWN [Stylonychia lemnae]|eukprot:CDW91255.1 UNKNOWN [Stylonychia lemnae]
MNSYSIRPLKVFTMDYDQANVNSSVAYNRMPQTYLLKRIRKRKPYHYINSGIRRYLLYLVKDLNFSIKDAASTLNINYSTAKTIIQVYKKTGRIDKVDKHLEIQHQLHYANQQLSLEISEMFNPHYKMQDMKKYYHMPEADRIGDNYGNSQQMPLINDNKNIDYHNYLNNNDHLNHSMNQEPIKQSYTSSNQQSSSLSLTNAMFQQLPRRDVVDLNQMICPYEATNDDTQEEIQSSFFERTINDDLKEQGQMRIFFNFKAYSE